MLKNKHLHGATNRRGSHYMLKLVRIQAANPDISILPKALYRALILELGRGHPLHPKHVRVAEANGGIRIRSSLHSHVRSSRHLLQRVVGSFR